MTKNEIIHCAVIVQLEQLFVTHKPIDDVDSVQSAFLLQRACITTQELFPIVLGLPYKKKGKTGYEILKCASHSFQKRCCAQRQIFTHVCSSA